MKPPHEPKGHPAKEPASGEDVERLREEVKRLNDQYLRTLAEVENTKKRLHREKEEFARYAAETVVRELLPILDSLDQALVAVEKPSDLPAAPGAAQAGTEAVIKGVHLIHRQLLGLLQQEGVKRIPTVGEVFDPHRHEAVAQVDATDGAPDNTIVEEVQVGYTMHGRVIRPAMVKVAAPSATSDKRQATREHPAKEQHTTNNTTDEVGGHNG